MAILECHCQSLSPYYPSGPISSASRHHNHRFAAVSCSSSSTPHPITAALQKTISEINDSGVIACLRAPSADMAREAAKAALGSGISVLEIVVSTPGVFQVVHELVQEYPTSTIGVGTVLKVEDAKKAVESGAKFLMSPATVTGILDYSRNYEFLYMPGVMTPTELLSANAAGAHIVKVYPVSSLGGVKYISALSKPFPHIPMVASQGITIDSVADYIACGAVSVVLSDAIFSKEAIAQKNYSLISRLAYIASCSGKDAVKRYVFRSSTAFQMADHALENGVIWNQSLPGSLKVPYLMHIPSMSLPAKPGHEEL